MRSYITVMDNHEHAQLVTITWQFEVRGVDLRLSFCFFFRSRRPWRRYDKICVSLLMTISFVDSVVVCWKKKNKQHHHQNVVTALSKSSTRTEILIRIHSKNLIEILNDTPNMPSVLIYMVSAEWYITRKISNTYILKKFMRFKMYNRRLGFITFKMLAC